jgi:hypothetical protein
MEGSSRRGHLGSSFNETSKMHHPDGGPVRKRHWIGLGCTSVSLLVVGEAAAGSFSPANLKYVNEVGLLATSTDPPTGTDSTCWTPKDVAGTKGYVLQNGSPACTSKIVPPITATATLGKDSKGQATYNDSPANVADIFVLGPKGPVQVAALLSAPASTMGDISTLGALVAYGGTVTRLAAPAAVSQPDATPPPNSPTPKDTATTATGQCDVAFPLVDGAKLVTDSDKTSHVVEPNGSEAHIDIDVIAQSTVYAPPRNTIRPNQGIIVRVCHARSDTVEVSVGGTRGTSTPATNNATTVTPAAATPPAGSDGGTPQVTTAEDVVSVWHFAPRQPGSADVTVTTHPSRGEGDDLQDRARGRHAVLGRGSHWCRNALRKLERVRDHDVRREQPAGDSVATYGRGLRVRSWLCALPIRPNRLHRTRWAKRVRRLRWLRGALLRLRPGWGVNHRGSGPLIHSHGIRVRVRAELLRCDRFRRSKDAGPGARLSTGLSGCTDHHHR